MVDDVPRNPDKANSCDVKGDEKARPDPKSEEYDALQESEQEKRFKLFLLAIREFYEILNMDALILDSFKTNTKMLKHFNLTKLINSSNVDHRDLGIKFSLLLYRYDSETKLGDITNAPDALEKLQKQDVKETWQKLGLKRLVYKEQPPIQSPRIDPTPDIPVQAA